MGIAHVEDLEAISDIQKRISCERQALNFAKHLLKGRSRYSDIAQVCSAVQGSH